MLRRGRATYTKEQKSPIQKHCHSQLSLRFSVFAITLHLIVKNIFNSGIVFFMTLAATFYSYTFFFFLFFNLIRETNSLRSR